MKSYFILFLLFTTFPLFNFQNLRYLVGKHNCPPSDYVEKMFCFQCEQTAGGKGCTKGGVCGKKSNIAILQDYLTGALVTLATKNKKTKENNILIIKSLFTTITNANFDENFIENLINEVHKASGDETDFCMTDVWNGQEDIRSLKSLILFGLRGMAAYAYHAHVLGFENEEVNSFFYDALRSLKEENSTDRLLSMVLKVGEVNFKCMQLLDEANTKTYGNPVPVEVPLSIEKGPFIVITGHDLLDLKLLLEQTKDKNINIYTHGEMIPAHGYPELKKYKHLKGNFGTAWQNQQKEFDNIPAPVLFTTNCIMPPKKSYIDRIFTTNIVSYPGTKHIDKDFSELIKKSIELGGYKELQKRTGINGGEKVMTGFGRNTVISHAEEIVKMVKSGQIKHFFAVAGCDGAKPGRNYYTEFVKKTPKNSIVLTAACGKFRFNDLPIEKIGNFPRILDMGQCNDAYGIVQVALALSKAFNVGVNDLPLSIVLSWYEQKAVCVLLTLIYLGIKNIKLGPSLPAFLSKNILKILVDNYNIGPISTPDEDLKTFLK